MESVAGAEIAGRVSKTFGTGGELVLNLYDTFPYENPVGESVFVAIDGIGTPFFFQSFRRQGQRKAVAVFDDLESEYRASELVGKEFFVYAEAEKEEANDEIYLEDLIGYSIQIEGHTTVGRITDYIDSEFNPLFEVEWGGEGILIPAVEEFFVAIDEQKRTIRLDLPEGLLAING